MGINYFGDITSQASSSSSSSSSRKGKKKSGTDKPKQPQRGLGVAQLEKIRLHGQLGSSSNNYHASPFLKPYSSNYNYKDDEVRMQTVYNSSSSSSPSGGFPIGHDNGVRMGFTDLAKSNMACGNYQSTSFARWIPENEDIITTKSFFEQRPNQASLMINKKNKEESESDSSQDIDLELRLSIR